MGILSGLKNFGIDIDGDIYEDNKARDNAEEEARLTAKEEAEAARLAAEEEKKKKLSEETTYLLAKSYECPVCSTAFKSLAVKANRSRVVGHDLDLRPRYEPVDTLKYTVVSCPCCGYSALVRNFSNITATQKKIVREKISCNFLANPEDGKRTIYTYEDALERFELAFATAMAITAKTSEKAYLCLQMSWLVRGQRKALDDTRFDYVDKYVEYRNTERELQKKALEGFVYAAQNETFPMCGSLDQYTVNYIIAAMYYKTREFDKSLKLLSNILVAPGARKSIKENAREIKEKILKIKASNVIPEEDEMED